MHFRGGRVRVCRTFYFRTRHQPMPSLVNRIQEHSRPSSLREVKSFLGLPNYYREFIEDFSRVASPLYYLTQNNVQWVWGKEQEESFRSLCSVLSSKP